MKKLLAVILVLLLAFSVAACGKDDDGDSKKDDKKSENSSKKDDKDNKGDNKGDDKGDDKIDGIGDGIIIKVIGDKVTLPVGGQARDSWHAQATLRTYEFDADGKCVKSEDIYYLDDVANYELSKEHLEGGNWKAEFSADKTSFTIDNQYITYTDPDDALEYFNSRYYAYTIQYKNGAEKHVDSPDEATKLANIKEIYGIDFEDVKGLLGFFAVATWQREAINIQMSENSTLDDMNALGAKLFEVCKPLADDGKMYTYLGKYGDEVTELPKAGSEFESAEFHYYRNGKEIKVSVGISQKLNKAMTLYIGVVK